LWVARKKDWSRVRGITKSGNWGTVPYHTGQSERATRIFGSAERERRGGETSAGTELEKETSEGYLM